MGRPIRHWEPGRLYFITQRTIHGRLLMRPSPEANDLIGGILAKGVHDFGVRLYGFVVLSNHLHLIASHDTDGRRLTDFMQFVGSCIARKVGRLVRWGDRFWARRFSAEPILDDDAALGRLRYIFGHGVKEGLVASAVAWPGLTCIPELVERRRREFVWESWSKRLWLRLSGGGREPRPELYQERHTLELCRLPALSGVAEADFRVQMAALVAQAEREAREQRGGKAVLGVDAVLKQGPQSRPQRVSRSPRPLCHASNRPLGTEFRKWWRDLVSTYREASASFREGQRDVEFPAGTYPPWPRAWDTGLVAA